MADKKYVGNGKENGDYGIINISVCLSDVNQQDITEYEGKKYLRLSVGRKRETDQYGKTHSVWVNDYVPNSQKEEAPRPAKRRTLEEPVIAGGSDLPF